MTVRITEAVQLFSDYEYKMNSQKYAKVSSARAAEFAAYCAKKGIRHLEDVNSEIIGEWLDLTPRETQPGAWRNRYILVRVFLNYLVFEGKLKADKNPVADAPGGETLTNKRLFTLLEFSRLLMCIPNTHQGTQDTACC